MSVVSINTVFIFSSITIYGLKFDMSQLAEKLEINVTRKSRNQSSKDIILHIKSAEVAYLPLDIRH